MQVVIDIDEEYKTLLDNGDADGSVRKSILLAVINGTILPKGHGDLKDVSKLNDVEIYDRSNDMYGASSDQIMNAPTIIEADKR